jgi:hypothetical protein
MFQRGKAGCLRLIKHHIAVNFDARFTGLQDDRCGNDLFAAV